MSKLVTVTVTAPFTLDGHAYQAGETLTCGLVQAMVLGRRGHIAMDAQQRPVYATRDMVAAPVAAPVVVVTDDDEVPRKRTRR